MGKDDDEEPQKKPQSVPTSGPEKPRVQIPPKPRPELINIQTEGTEGAPEKKKK
jgi:hypothetical protein